MLNLNCKISTRWLVLAGVILATAFANAVEPVNATFFGKIAIKGYDPVAYFTMDAAVKGNKKYAHEWRGASWHFSKQENLQMFKEAPEKYAPQYGGYCAYAVAQNDTANIDPTQYTVYGGKLYLNYNKKINRKWLANKESFIKEADTHWPGLLDK
ncbi:MAG: YHS domain-containing (seleno)protein [Pseudomonadales bacterium]